MICGGRIIATVCTLAAIAAGCFSSRETPIDRRGAPLVWGGEQKLLASDAAELDQFGCSVSLAHDRALVGAFGESDGRGAAYVFVQSGDAWIEEQKLVASDGAELDKFGSSTSLGTDRILVGAYGAGSSRGAAYVFVKSGDAWTEEQKLVASDGAAGENFGYSVSLAGDRVLVGAHGSGAAYVFVRGGSAWTEEQKLVASDGAADDAFGWSVALVGDRALVGAPGNDGARGTAYVFVRSGSAWTEEQELVANDGVAFDNFGSAVSLAGQRALVGAYWNDDFRGAAYVFVKSGGSWTAEQKLVASDGAANQFGSGVSLVADRALIGAFAYDNGRGAAYVFSRNGDGNTWTEEQRLVPSDGQADLFAWSVSLAADRALLGAMYNDQLRGAAYLFSLGVENRDAGSADAGVDVQDRQDRQDGQDGQVGQVGQDGGPIEAGHPGPGSCIRGDECTSGHCEDGLCCDRTCAANERCRAELKVSGEDGACGPAKAAAPGAPCKFDVQCTSGHCSLADGVCDDAAPDGACTSGDACVNGAESSVPGDGGGCGCRAGNSPAHSPRAWLGVGLVLLLLRRPPRPSVRRHSLAWRRCWQVRLRSRRPIANPCREPE
jgi:MYXO-CTERM domain-containing protein